MEPFFVFENTTVYDVINSKMIVMTQTLYETPTFHNITVGPESVVNYFQKGAILDQKAVLNLWYVDTKEISLVDTRPNVQKLFPSIYVMFGL